MIEIKSKVIPAFLPLYKGELANFREIIYYGGRGGGKTRQLTQYCFLQALASKKNIVCLRTYKESQRDSLLLEFKDLIHAYDIQYQESSYVIKDFTKAYGINVNVNEIRFKNGSKIIFRGISKNTYLSLKSLSNFHIAFYDECSEITEEIYKVLVPSIRGTGAQLIFSFNPLYETDFISQKVLNHKIDSNYTYIKRVNFSDNPLFPKELDRDRLESKKNDSLSMYKWIWEGEFLQKGSSVINTDTISFFDTTIAYKYKHLFITMDTAYTTNTHADYSVISLFGIIENDLHILRIMRGKWEFGELSQNLTYMYNFAIEKYKKNVTPIIIEEKSSGISLIQELKKLTNFSVKGVKPTTDKFTRLSQVLHLLPHVKIPLDKSDMLNSWVDIFLKECQ